MAITGIDKVPVGFVLKVYETKALAEEGDEKNALYIFSNGTDTDSADGTLSNGSQFVGTGSSTTTGSSGATLKDSSARFGSRLIGKKIINSSVADTATHSGSKESTVSAVDSDGKGLTCADDISFSTSHSYYIEDPSHFFTFKKYFYRLESTDAVRGFEIDWDDGEDNSAEKANRQKILLDTPAFSAVTSHTYTTHGIHYPMIRTISTDGFYSKWYVSYDAQASGLDSIETQTLSTGQNNFSIVSLDNSTIPRIPGLAPANSAPIGVLKTDRSIVYSSIDNSPFLESTMTNPTVYCYVERSSGGTPLSSYTDRIQIVWEDTTGQIYKDIVGAHSAKASLTADHTIGAYGGGAAPYVRRILSAKLLNLSEAITTTDKASMLAADERVILYGMAQGGTEAPNSDPVISMLSLGNPIQYLNRPGFYTTLDGSQSQTRCSNVNIDYYTFDTGKLENVTATTGAVNIEKPYYGPGEFEQISDILGAALGADNPFKQSDSSLQVNYTFAPNSSVLSSSSGNVIDATTKRFFDDERLARLQVIDSSATSRHDAARYFTNATDSGSNVSEAVDSSETAIDVDDLSNFNIGDVISPSSSVDASTHEQMLVSDVGDGSGAGTLQVVRQYNSSASNTMSSSDSLYILNDNGQLGDTFTNSFVEHWNNTSFADNVVRPDSYKSRSLLMYGTEENPTSIAGTMHWKEKSRDYRYNSRATSLVSPDTATTGETGLIFGGTRHGTATATNGTQLNGDEFIGLEAKRPANYLLMCKSKKFNKIHLRLKNNFSMTDAANECISSSVWGERQKVQLYLWYTARETPSSSTYIWKALPFSDGTMCRTYEDSDTGLNSLRRSGTISFDMPNDWVNVKSTDLTWSTGSGGASKPIPDEDDSGDADPASTWIDSMYGLMLGVSITGVGAAPDTAYRCVNVQSYNNSHSQAITIQDPHHKSLNDIGIAQSISWNRRGKYVNINDMTGRGEIRKIGAEGGTVTFGGVELKDDYSTQKKLLNIYQREATPVYLDIQRAVNSGEYIRFFGVLTNMSEDYPVGQQKPKFGLSMSITHVCEYDRNTNDAAISNWIGQGMMSLGGEVIDVVSYAP